MKNYIYMLLIAIQSMAMSSQTLIYSPLFGSSIDDQFGWAVAISGDGSRFIASAQGFNNSAGQIKMYSINNNTIQQIGTSISGTGPNDLFGTSVAISADGNRVASGAIGSSNFTGRVTVYELVNGTWTPLGNVLQGGSISDEFGDAISLSQDGTVLAVGAIGQNNYKGGVKIYGLSNDQWQQIGGDLIGDTDDDYLGDSVHLSDDGTTVLVGIPGKNNDTGAARVFKNINDNWVQIGSDLNGTGAFSEFGFITDISGDGNTIAIAAPVKNNDTGEVTIYENSNNSWVQKGAALQGDTPNDIFGSSVSLSEDGNVLIVGIAGQNNFIGAVNMYEFINNDWTSVGTPINGNNPGDILGLSTAISNDGLSLVVGAPQFDGQGYVSAYQLNGTLSNQDFDTNSFTVYPNPATTVLHIAIGSNDSLKTSTLYNILGQQVMTSSAATIDVSSLTKGMYIVDIQTRQGGVQKKFIIN
jgi:hypothetical protein